MLLHYTGMFSSDDAVRWLCAPESEVSSHYFVTEAGEVLRLVDEADRAWHAGRSCWGGEREINARSVGIEIANAGHRTIDARALPPPFADAQIEALIDLVADIAARHGIAPERVLGHSDVSPGRKIDPGEMFPWDRLAASGVGHFVPPAPIADGAVLRVGDRGDAVTEVQSLLALYGYDVPVTGDYCERTGIVVTAFQRHFRPERIDGCADASTLDTLRRLLDTLG